MESLSTWIKFRIMASITISVSAFLMYPAFAHATGAYISETFGESTNPAVSLAGSTVNNISGITLAPGAIGMAAKFINSSSSIEYSCSQTFSKLNGSAEVLVKFDDFTSRDAAIWHTNNSKYVLYYDYASDGTQKRITGRVGGESTPLLYSFDQSTGAKNTLSEDEWHHIVLTWEGAPTGTSKMYIDGTLVDTRTYTNGADCTSFRLGNSYSNSMNWKDGWIDEFKLHLSTKTADEVTALYQASGISSSVGASSELELDAVSVPASTLQETQATVTWYTNVAATSFVYYVKDGLTSWTWQGTDEALTRNHSVALPDLLPNTTYNYYVSSTDENGTMAKSETKQFTTPGETAVAPVISAISHTIGDVYTTVSWKTDVPTESYLYFRKKGASSWGWTQSDKNQHEHSYAILAPESAQTYEYYIFTVRTDYNLGTTSATYVFTTNADTGEPTLDQNAINNGITPILYPANVQYKDYSPGPVSDHTSTFSYKTGLIEAEGQSMNKPDAFGAGLESFGVTIERFDTVEHALASFKADEKRTSVFREYWPTTYGDEAFVYIGSELPYDSGNCGGQCERVQYPAHNFDGSFRYKNIVVQVSSSLGLKDGVHITASEAQARVDAFLGDVLKNFENRVDAFEDGTLDTGFSMPDFTIRDFLARQDLQSVSHYDMTLSFTILNIGNSKTNKTFAVRVDNQTTGKNIYTQNFGGMYYEPNKPHATTYAVGRVGEDFAIGNNEIQITIDATYAIPESSEGNNVMTYTVYVANPSDAESATYIETPAQANEDAKTQVDTRQDSNDEVVQLRDRIKRLELQISKLERDLVETEKRLTVSIDQSLTRRVVGRILLQVEGNGEAWYVDPVSEERYYLRDGATAHSALQAFGLGITNADLAKIPVGIEDRAEAVDADADGLDDRLEEALGTDLANSDSDGDGHIDGEEVKNGYSPLGPGATAFNTALANRLEGKILLQVEKGGQAWYVHDGKRFYMKDGQQAYQIMRYLSLGITNTDLRKIAVGEFE